MLDESAKMLAAELAHREVKHVQMRELLDGLTFQATLFGRRTM